MKQLTLLIIIIIATLGMASAQMRKCYENHKLSIDLQGDFKNEQVEIIIDGQTFIKGKYLTADNGLALQKAFIFPEGMHNLKIIVNNRPIKVDFFSLTHDQHIGISYYPTMKVANITYSNIEFSYTKLP